VTVYEGIKSFYTEDDETKPVNVYGRSKVVAEIYVKSNYANYAILRSSIIYGPQPFIPLPKTLPLQVKFFLAKFAAFLKIPYIPLFCPHK
jgi:dTDP-4-dehydrorhamnose reductase